MIIPFATNSYKSKSLPLSSQRVSNMYAETEPADAKSQISIFGAPGIMDWVTLGTGPIRGMWSMANVLYAVSGGQLYTVAADGTATLLGGTISGTDPVAMSDNSLQLIIVNGTLGYIYSLVGGFQLITSANFHPASTVTFFDSFFVLNWVDTNKIFISGSLDGVNYLALDFASAEVNPDYVVAVLNQQENLLVFGQETIETWYNAGDVNFPFKRYDGATIERGCVAAKSIIKEDNSVFFLGNDVIYYRLNGIIPVRISTHALEAEWATYPTQSDAFAIVYTWEGHKFIALTFPSGNKTWEYDIATNLWHERESFSSVAEPMGRWRGNVTCPCYGKTYVGDAFSGKIGYLSDVNTEFGNPIIGEMVNPVIHSDRKRVFMSRFELDVETGVGVTTGQGSDPQVMVSFSDDGGRTFGNLQRWESMGAIGEYQKRLRWLRNGQFRNRVIKITISDPVRRNIIANYADLKVGMN